MSIKNGVNEVFIQKVSLIFETSKGEEVTEVWNFVKNENIQPKTYDFVEFLNLDGFYDCKDLNELKNKLRGVKLGEKISSETLKPILSDKNIFGVDLYEVGLAAKVEQYLNELLAGTGAVRATLHKYVN